MKTHMHIHRSRSRRAFTALLVSAALLVTSISTPCPAFAASGSSKSSLITVKTPSKEDIVKFMQEHPTGDIYFDEDGKSTGKTHETDYLTAPKTSAPYEAGRLAESEEAAALNTIKTIRYIAGISSGGIQSAGAGFRARQLCQRQADAHASPAGIDGSSSRKAGL